MYIDYFLFVLGYEIPLETVHHLCLKRNLLQNAGDFWEKFDCDEVLDVKIGAVDSNYWKKGLGGDMILANLSIGKLLGIEVNSTYSLINKKPFN